LTVAEHIIHSLDYRGTTKQWLADKIGITKQTMNYKLTHNSFTAEELLQIAKALEIDLNLWL
jgi:DNA-binding XRE family transcriptional regulator